MNRPSQSPNFYQEDREIEICISLTLSKTCKIKVNDYEILEKGIDEDGFYFEDIDYKNCNLKDTVEDQIILPSSAYKYVSNSKIKEDLKDWIIDDFEVILE